MQVLWVYMYPKIRNWLMWGKIKNFNIRICQFGWTMEGYINGNRQMIQEEREQFSSPNFQNKEIFGLLEFFLVLLKPTSVIVNYCSWISNTSIFGFSFRSLMRLLKKYAPWYLKGNICKRSPLFVLLFHIMCLCSRMYIFLQLYGSFAPLIIL